MYTTLLLWCFVKLTQLRPSRLDPVSVVAEEHVSARLSSIAMGGHALAPDRTLQPYPCNGCDSVGVSYQAIRPILGGPEDSL